MTDRESMDTPAALTALVLGVLLITVGGLLFAFGPESAGGKTYTVAWAQTDAGGATGQASGNSGSTEVPLTVTDVIASNATVTFTCTDNRGAGNLAPAMTVTWTFKHGNTTVLDGTSCEPGTHQISAHPDVAEVQADSASDALQAAYKDGANATSTYTLTFSWSRPSGGVPNPLPVGGPSFSATLSVGVQKWTATVNEKTPEVGK